MRAIQGNALVPELFLVPRTRNQARVVYIYNGRMRMYHVELELELIQTQMAQKPMLRAEVGMRVRCANKASAE